MSSRPSLRPADRPPLASLAVLAVAAASAAHFLHEQRPWLDAFAEDLGPWLRDPEVGGPLRIEQVGGLSALVLLSVVAGWAAARVVLGGTDLAHDRPTIVGTALILGPVVLGLSGVVAVVAGSLAALEIAALTTLQLVALVVVGRRRSRLTPPQPTERPPFAPVGRWVKASVTTVAVLIAGFVFLHAIWSPVTEWDSVIYHAATARVWFESRPNPPLLFGPSLGFEISANYPPLYPAIGAAGYTLLGQVNDLLVRVLSPIFGVGSALVMFGWARARLGEASAWWATLVLTGCPLFLAYGGWPSSYLLLTSLTVLAFVSADLAARSDRSAGWVVAGAVTGLAVLTHFFGLLALLFGPVAAVAARRRAAGDPRGAWRPFITRQAIFAASAGVVAAPWLLRNLLRLSDPLYPLGAPFFNGRGLGGPLWDASREEIQNNALGYWSADSAVPIRGQQILTELFDRHLLPTGTLVAIVGLIVWRRHRYAASARYAALVGGVLFLVQLGPGWFWLRALLPGVPLVAIVAGWSIATARGDLTRLPLGQETRPRVALRGVAFAATACVAVSCAVVGLALAVAGPNQDTWTTGLRSDRDLLGSVRTLGDDRQRLWTVYGGDLLAWEWVNENLGPDQAIATLDPRLYYLDRPLDLLYLDGLAGLPLLAATTPETAVATLTAEGASFVLVPGWAISNTPTRHPAVDVLPLFDFLGGPDFPVVAVFAPSASDAPTVIYAVGPHDEAARVVPFLGAGSAAPTIEETEFTFPARQTDGRIMVPVEATGGVLVQFDYATDEPGAFQLHIFDPVDRSWRLGVVAHAWDEPGGWLHAATPVLPSTNEYAQIGVFTETALRIRDLRYTRPDTPVAVGSTAPRPNADVAFAADDVTGQIFVPADDGVSRWFRFEYRTRSAERLDINRFDSGTSTWELGLAAAALEADDRWHTLTVPVTGDMSGFARLGVYAAGGVVELRDLVVADAAPPAVIEAPVIDPSDIQVQVLNGTTTSGRARAVTDALATLGFELLEPDNFPGQNVDVTEIRYRSNRRAAESVADAVLGTSELIVDPSMDVDLLVVLGTSFEGVTESPG